MSFQPDAFQGLGQFAFQNEATLEPGVILPRRYRGKRPKYTQEQQDRLLKKANWELLQQYNVVTGREQFVEQSIEALGRAIDKPSGDQTAEIAFYSVADVVEEAYKVNFDSASALLGFLEQQLEAIRREKENVIALIMIFAEV